MKSYPRKLRVRATLVLSLLLFACGGSSSGGGAKTSKRPETGDRLYRRQQCIQCHGVGGRGMPGMGPALRNLSEHWTRETLDEYLLDPQAVTAKSDRLGKNSNYRMKMPPVRGVEDSARALLIDYILTL